MVDMWEQVVLAAVVHVQAGIVVVQQPVMLVLQEDMQRVLAVDNLVQIVPLGNIQPQQPIVHVLHVRLVK
jgi:hypothetical protein